MERSFLFKWTVCDLWKDKIETIKGMFCPFCGNHVMIFIKLYMENNLKQNSLHFELLRPACGYWCIVLMASYTIQGFDKNFAVSLLKQPPAYAG